VQGNPKRTSRCVDLFSAGHTRNLARAPREDVHKSLMTLEVRVKALRGEAHSDVRVQQVIARLSTAVREQLSGVRGDLNTATAGQRAVSYGYYHAGESRLGVHAGEAYEHDCNSRRNFAVVSQHAVMLEMPIGSRFNIPQVALLVPTK
jgi:hypothetical protein